MFTFADSYQSYAVGDGNTSGGHRDAFTSSSDFAYSYIRATDGRWGTKCLRVGGGPYVEYYWPTGSQPAGTFNTAVTSPQPYGGARPIVTLMNGTTPQLSVNWNDTSGAFEVRRGGEGATIIGTTVAGLRQPSSWNYVELVYEIHPTAGRFELYIDGLLRASATGINTRNAADNNVTSFRLESAGSAHKDHSDTFTTNTYARVGERRIDPLLIVGNGASQDFVANTGAANAAVAESSPNADTTYISAGVVGNRSTFALADLPNNPLTIDAVIVRATARKDDAATRAIKVGLTDGANTVLSPDQALGTGYAHKSAILSAAPDGGAWTKAKVDALLAVVEVSV